MFWDRSSIHGKRTLSRRVDSLDRQTPRNFGVPASGFRFFLTEQNQIA
jgi:hypothetical protein